MRRHPRDAALLDWLSGAPDERVDEHLDSCGRCADTLERLAEDAPVIDLVPALTEALAADAELEERVLEKASAAIAARQAGAAFFDLFGIGIETVKIVFNDEEEQS